MGEVINTGLRIGPTLAAELATAGLADLGVGWRADGVLSFDDGTSQANIDAVLAVLAVHNPVPTAFATSELVRVGADPATSSQGIIFGAFGAAQPALGLAFLETIVSGSNPLRSRLNGQAGLNFAVCVADPSLASYRSTHAADLWLAVKADPVFGVKGTNAAHITAAEVTAAQAAALTLGLGDLTATVFGTSTFPILPHSIVAAALAAPTAIPASSTRYLSWFGSGLAFDTIESNVQKLALTTRTLYSLRVLVGAQPASGSLVVTVRADGVDTALTLTVPAGSSAGVYRDVPTTPIAVGATSGQPPVLSVKYVNNATSTTAPISGHEVSSIGTEAPA